MDDHEPEATLRPSITVFRSRRRTEVDPTYDAWAAATEAAARAIPGFVEVKTFTAADGEHVTISIFDSPISHEAWRAHPLHLEAQSLGRSDFYDAYDLVVGEILRQHSWTREPETPSIHPE